MERFQDQRSRALITEEKMVTATRPEPKVKIGPTKLLINNEWVESVSVDKSKVRSQKSKV